MPESFVDDSLRKEFESLRKEFDDCLTESKKNGFVLYIVPLWDVTTESLPDGFYPALVDRLKKRKPGLVDRNGKIKNLKQHCYLLPWYHRRKNEEVGYFRNTEGIESALPISSTIDGKQHDFSVVLWSDSRFGHHDGEESVYHKGGLTSLEREYRRFMDKAGSKLLIHDRNAGKSCDQAWLSFLVQYIWAEEQPPQPRNYATVKDIGLVTVRAIDDFIIGHTQLSGFGSSKVKNSAVVRSTPKRGRPKGTPKFDPSDDQRIVEAWKSGTYTSIDELASEFRMRKPDVVKALDRNRKRLPRRNK